MFPPVRLEIQEQVEEDRVVENDTKNTMNIDLSNILFESDSPQSKCSNEGSESKEDRKIKVEHKDEANIEMNIPKSSVNRYKEN